MLRRAKPEVPAWEEMAVVGRVARAHGLRGQVIINPETDFPAERFRPGEEVWVWRQGQPERLRILAVRFFRERPIVSFVGVETIEEATAFAGVDLRVPVGRLARLPAGVFYRHDLIGCRVVTAVGEDIGTVIGLEGAFEASRLVVASGDRRILIPLVEDICTEIKPAEQRIVVAPPAGLLNLA